MKVSCKLPLLICLVLATLPDRCALCQPQKELSKLCYSDKNPFIKNLKENGVKLFQTPQVVTNRCGSEWKTYGTCCEASSLETYIKKEFVLFSTTTQAFPKEIDGLISLLQNTQKTFSPMMRDSIKSLQHRILICSKTASAGPTQNEYLMHKFKRSELEFISTKATKIFEFVNIAKKELPIMSSRREVCVKKLETIMTSALCSACSGRSESFFESSKALMKISDCKSVIDSCHDYWSSMIEIIDGLNEVRHLIQKAAEKVPGASSKLTKSSDYLGGWLKKHDMKGNFKNCPSEQNCKDSAAQEICSSLIKIRSPLKVLTASMTSVNTQKANFDYFTAQTEVALGKKQPPPTTTTKSNFGTKRLLSGGDFSENSGHSYSSDFTVVPNDYFASFGRSAPMPLQLSFL